MSVVIPPQLNWLVELTAGQSYPKGDPDRLRAVGDAWNTAQDQIRSVVSDVSDSSNAMLEGFSGPAAEQFVGFMNSLYTNIPAMGDGAGGVRDMANNLAVQIEYSQFMILLQMIWMAEQIAEWSSTVFGAAAVPVIEAAGQIAVREILITLGKQVARSVAMSVAMQEGMDAAVQAFQMFVLKDRKQWNTASTVGAIEMGAVAGALGVGLHLGEQKLMPNLVKSLPGHIGFGAFNGAVISEVSNVAFGMGGSPFLGAVGGAVGGFLGHRREPGEGGGGSVGTIDMPVVDEKGFDFPGDDKKGGGGPGDGFGFDFDAKPPADDDEDEGAPLPPYQERPDVTSGFGGADSGLGIDGDIRTLSEDLTSPADEARRTALEVVRGRAGVPADVAAGNAPREAAFDPRQFETSWGRLKDNARFEAAASTAHAQISAELRVHKVNADEPVTLFSGPFHELTPLAQAERRLAYLHYHQDDEGAAHLARSLAAELARDPAVNRGRLNAGMLGHGQADSAASGSASQHRNTFGASWQPLDRIEADAIARSGDSLSFAVDEHGTISVRPAQTPHEPADPPHNALGDLHTAVASTSTPSSTPTGPPEQTRISGRITHDETTRHWLAELDPTPGTPPDDIKQHLHEITTRFSEHLDATVKPIHPWDVRPGTDLDHEYGHLAGPAIVKDREYDSDRVALRLNPFRYTLHDFTRALLDRHGATWLFTVDEHGGIVLGAQHISRLIYRTEVRALETGRRQAGPQPGTRITDTIGGLGHPTLAPRFDQGGRALPAPGRISGELAYNFARARWEINSNSGRYMHPAVRPGQDGESRWLQNVAERISSRFGIPVTPVGRAAPTRLTPEARSLGYEVFDRLRKNLIARPDAQQILGEDPSGQTALDEFSRYLGARFAAATVRGARVDLPPVDENLRLTIRDLENLGAPIPGHQDDGRAEDTVGGWGLTGEQQLRLLLQGPSTHSRLRAVAILVRKLIPKPPDTAAPAPEPDRPAAAPGPATDGHGDAHASLALVRERVGPPVRLEADAPARDARLDPEAIDAGWGRNSGNQRLGEAP